MAAPRKRNGVAFSAVHRPIGTPSEQLLLPNDLLYLQFYNLSFKDASDLIISGKNFVYFISRPTFDITSTPFRAAILAFASLGMPGDRRADSYAYHDIFYRAASEAVKKEDSESLMYASYVMAASSIRHEASTRDALLHCAQYCRTLLPALSRKGGKRLGKWVSEMWSSLLCSAYIRYWFDQYRKPWCEVYVKGMGSIVNPNWEFHRNELPHEYAVWSRWPNLFLMSEMLRMSTESILIVIQTYRYVDRAYVQLYLKAVYLQIYVERCLFDKLYAPETSTFTEPLRLLVIQIIEMTDTLHDWSPLRLLEIWFRCYDATSRSPIDDPVSDHDAFPPRFCLIHVIFMVTISILHLSMYLLECSSSYFAVTSTIAKRTSRKHTSRRGPPSSYCGQLCNISHTIRPGQRSLEEICFGLDSLYTRGATYKVFDNITEG